jgi:autotransporter-associated beta strand protein
MSSNRMFLSAACVVLWGIAGASFAVADDVVWLGDTSTNFNDGANWIGGAPPQNDTTSDVAVFDADAYFDPRLKSDRSMRGIDFRTAGWTLASPTNAYGDYLYSLTLGADGIDSAAGGLNSVDVESIVFDSSQIWTVASGNVLAVSADIPSNPFELIKDGGGILKFTGEKRHFSMTTTVLAGELELHTSGVNNYALRGRLNIGAAAGPPAKVTCFNEVCMRDVDIYVYKTGTLDLRDRYPKIDSLTIDEGLVDTGSYGWSGPIIGESRGPDDILTMTGGTIATHGGGGAIRLYCLEVKSMAHAVTSRIERPLWLRGSLTADETHVFNVEDGAAAIDMEIVNVVHSDGYENHHVRKTGDGVLRFAGNNKYAGSTVVSAGVLLIDGTTSEQDDYTVQAGATLGGCGQIGQRSNSNRVTVETGGILAPGDSIGQLSVAKLLVLEDGAEYHWELGESLADYDKIYVGKGITFNGNPTVKLSNPHGLAITGHDPFVLFTAGAGTTPPDPSVLTLDYGDTGWAGGSLSVVGQDIVLSNLTPEPATAGLLALGALGLLRRRRRR